MENEIVKEKSARMSNFEIIRIIAMFLIIFSSALPYGATYQAGGGYDSVFVDLSITNIDAQHIIFTFLRYGGQIGDTLFVLCSAWFLVESSRFKLNKAIKMIFDSLLISLIGLGISLFLLRPSTLEIIKSIFPMTFQLNWFVGCYIVYYLLHPLINRAISGLNQKNLGLLALALFIAYSVISVVYSAYYFTYLVSFISIHILVFYVKKSKLYEIPKKNATIVCVVSALVLFLVVIAIEFAGNFIGIVHNNNLLLAKFYNPLIIVLCLFLILSVSHSKPWFNTKVNYFSSLSLLVYLLHGNYFLLTYGKYEIYLILHNHIESLLLCFVIYCLSYVVIIPLTAILYKISFGKLTAVCSNGISTFLQRKLYREDEL